MHDHPSQHHQTPPPLTSFISSFHGSARKVSICHHFSKPLPPEARTPFSILNLSGQRLRYYQPYLGGRVDSVQYLRHGERGVLSFGATMTVSTVALVHQSRRGGGPRTA